MISILLIGAASALLLCAIAAKVLGAPKKASKSEKTEIMKRLLELSEGENQGSRTRSAGPSRTLSNQRTLPRNGPRKTTSGVSPALRTQ